MGRDDESIFGKALFQHSAMATSQPPVADYPIIILLVGSVFGINFFSPLAFLSTLALKVILKYSHHCSVSIFDIKRVARRMQKTG